MGEPSVQITTSGDTPLGPQLPLRLGRFTLCEELGAGGMATVYLARMQLAAGLERLVALKTIHPHLAKESAFVDMFLDEARIASHVTHPNVCSTHDFGEADGVYYLAMEYLLGEPVFDVINRLVDRFDEVKEVLPYLAARIIADACEGLHAAHTARGPNGEQLHIVHRDVSPQNLFLTYSGAVKVVDFGCAKAAERVSHTSTGVMKGKVGYAAPEQIKGQAADARADVWALGVCLWETLTLSPLFSRQTAVATAMAVLEEEIEDASDGRDWVPSEVAAIASKALNRDVDERYESARDMGRALRRFIADSGFTLESAELAEWMAFLLAPQHAARIEQTRRVREMDISSVQAGRLYEVTDADVELLEPASAPLEAVPLPDDDDYDDDPPEISGPMPRQRRRESTAGRDPAMSQPPALPVKKTRRWVVLLLSLVGLGLGGYYLQLYYEPAPWFLEIVGREPRAAAGSSEVGDPSADDEAGDPSADDEVDVSDGSEAAAEDSTGSEGDPATSPPEPDEPETTRARRHRSRPTVTTVISGGGGGGYAAASPPSTSAPSPAPARRAATGSLHISASTGWATVYLGSRSLGRTPVDRDLPVGTHRLRVLPYGNADAAETIVVHISAASGERLTIDVDAPP